MAIKSAKFEKSFASVHQMDNNQQPEFAFIGRSNVGKSSLINMITGQKALAKTSSRPGKTQIINRFIINDRWCLIDLPGYGFAKVSRKSRSAFDSMITDYLLNRQMLSSAFVLIDIRHKPQAIDLEFIEWCGVNGIPFQIIFTKADKMSKAKADKQLAEYQNALHDQGWESLPTMFISSAEHHTGKEEIIAFIEDLLT